MVLLPTYATLTALGFVSFILGYVFEYPELGVIGGVILLGAGGLLVEGDLQLKTGEIENSSATNETVITNQYEPVSSLTHFSLSFLTLILGGAMTLRSLDKFQEVA